MKILLTGKPKVGKSTLLEQFKKEYKGKMVGFIGYELRDSEGKRIGFEARNIEGKKVLFAHKQLIKSDFVVGNKYFVDKDVIDTYFVSEIEKAVQNNSELLLLDEIGRMEAFSQLFLQKVTEVLNSTISVLGTIVYDPEPWSLAFKDNPNVILITMTEQNREKLLEMLCVMFAEINIYLKLSQTMQHKLNVLARKYFDNNQFIQIKKLFQHAIYYISENRVAKIDDSKYIVKGNTNAHTVKKIEEQISCDCDLFNGRGKYQGQGGECSHIQSILLLQI